MKRASRDSQDAENNPKKQKIDDEELFHPSNHKRIADLLQPDADNTGFITGHIFMSWKPANGVWPMRFEVKEEDNIYRIAIQLTGKSFKHKDCFDFRLWIPFHLALKGARIEHTQATSANFVPLNLIYDEGIVVQYLSEGGSLVDTWQLEKEEEYPPNTWYSTPHNPRSIPRVSTAVMNDAASEERETTPMVSKQPKFNPYMLNTNIAQGTPTKGSIIAVRSGPSNPHHGGGEGLTKTEARRIRKKERKKELREAAKKAAEDARNPVLAPAPIIVVKPINPSIAANPPPAAIPPIAPEGEPLSTSEEKRQKDALEFSGGCHTESGDTYVPIASAARENKGSTVNIIGVVTSARVPSRVRQKKDWFISFSVVDPSNIDEYFSIASMGSVGLSINCFQDKYVEWLPRPAVGSIVILRRLKIQVFDSGCNAVGYNDKLRWALYNPETGVAFHGDRGDAPESAILNDGYSYSYSPYWTPREVELDYCKKLANWWDEVKKTSNVDVTTIQVMPTTRPGSLRQHRLISEAHPDMVPSGYFDCTAEIVRGFESNNGPYCLYITDYTVNSQVARIDSTWCPPHLADRLLQVEAWDDAAELARKMEPGEYWFLRNMRMKASRLGPFEAKLQEAYRVRKLDPSDSDSQPLLKALIERKKEFYATAEIVDGPANKFDTKLIQDVDGDVTFFNCTVEVLRINEDSELYVTDYTFSPHLPTFGTEWATNLAGRIVMIALEGGQKAKAKDLIPGHYYKINNMRIIKRGNAKYSYGRLGGDEKLIDRLDDLEDDEVKALLKRKDDWKREVERDNHISTPLSRPVQSTSTGALVPVTAALKRKKPRKSKYSTCTIKEVIDCETCPNIFYIFGHVVDFYPFSLEECVVQNCGKCKRDIPPNQRQCFDCDDLFTNNVRYRYRFFLRIKDESDETVDVLVCNECSLIKDLPPANIRDDQDAMKRFADHVRPVMGNLAEVHESWFCKVPLDVATPKLKFKIDCWPIKDGKERTYSLLLHWPL